MSDTLIRRGRIDPDTWTVEEAANALQIQCALQVQHHGPTSRTVVYQRSPAAQARRRAQNTLDEDRAQFWRDVASHLERKSRG